MNSRYITRILRVIGLLVSRLLTTIVLGPLASPPARVLNTNSEASHQKTAMSRSGLRPTRAGEDACGPRDQDRSILNHLLSQNRQIRRPWSDLLTILTRHDAGDLRDVAKIMNDPCRQQLG